VHGIPGAIILGLTCAVLAVFYLALIWAGLVIAASDPAQAPEPPAEAPDTEAPQP